MGGKGRCGHLRRQEEVNRPANVSLRDPGKGFQVEGEKAASEVEGTGGLWSTQIWVQTGVQPRTN